MGEILTGKAINESRRGVLKVRDDAELLLALRKVNLL